ncbi:MAG: glycosyltransferase [Candidatus Micrarchaeota archaeon]|nr:glycosyltransferase [Candidatus Micrarchaeota archaeon]
MKIGFFTDTYLPNVDGVVNSIISFRGELQKRGHKVSIYSSGDGAAAKRNTDPLVHYYDSFSFPLYPQYKVAYFPFAAKSDAAGDGLDVVHCHAMASMGLAAIQASKDLGLPLVGTFHTLLPQAAAAYARSAWTKRLAWRVTWRAIKLFYRPFQTVTAPTQVIRALLQEHGVRNAVVVPNGVDTRKFRPGIGGAAGVRRKLGVKPGEKMVLVAGRLSFEKNVDVLLEAARLMREGGKGGFKLVITGDGPARALYEKAAREKKVADIVTFTGFVPGRDLPKYYSACDLLATASTFETQGLSVLEAMACGKPAVAANAMALPETVMDDHNGFLFKPFDAAECAEKITETLCMPKKRFSKLCSNARKTAEEYSISRSTDRLLKVYEHALGE